MDEISGKWYLETVFPDLVMMLRVQKVLYSGKTEYQNVEVLESVVFGRSLVLDGKTQSTERDEHIYHEGLVQPAMLMHPQPRTVFIGGGGEGGTLREVLSHKSVERVVMLDLDQEVVDLCRRYLPQHHQGSFDDPRVELLHQDARAYLENCPQQFDVMVMDLVDPLEGGTAYLLYTDQYYRIAKSKLNPGGILVTQSGPAGLLAHQECFTTIHNTLQGVFNNVRGCQVHIPAFQTLWGFNIASDAELPKLDEPEKLDGLIAQRVNKPLKFYDGESHTNMFSLPKFLRQSMQNENRVNRDEAPVFMA
ncbi:MAG: polyamine aminopropyltransferase [Chloroflexi bacterium]|nr:polyamine aminopropyltransferase [Chloroflexota bacterium]PKB57115.1 MAG: spermidine synthase [SAR202 cluster bacterium Casp-Chloro-G3]